MSHKFSSNEEEEDDNDDDDDDEDDVEAGGGAAGAGAGGGFLPNFICCTSTSSCVCLKKLPLLDVAEDVVMLQLAQNGNKVDYEPNVAVAVAGVLVEQQQQQQLPEPSYKYGAYRSRSANQLTQRQDQVVEGEANEADDDDEEDVDDDDDDDDEEDADADPDADDDDDDDDTTPTTPYTYANESPSDYRPGGYHPVNVGDAFHQRYFAISKLGWGHYSTVWLCYDTQRNRYCAVKLVKSALLYAESARHEIRLLRHIAQLGWHPLRERLVNLTDNFSTSGINGTHQCLVFDVLGDNMLMLIQRSGYQGLPLYNVKQIAYQVLQGLYLLHDQGNLIHTDLKPENVLLVADDVALRSQAVEASGKYLLEHAQQQLLLIRNNEEGEAEGEETKLSKTAKRRLRTKTKQSVSFFRTHRKWLRERGIADLLQLARHGLLTSKMAIDAVTNQLPFLAYDGPTILNDAELQQLQSEQFTEQVGDTAQQPQPQPQSQPQPQPQSQPQPESQPLAGKKRGRERRPETGSKAMKLLNSSPEKFMRFVQKCIERDEKEDNEPFHSSSKRIKIKKPAKKPSKLLQVEQSQQQSMTAQPNLNLIKRTDPALEPCKLKVAIADVGNACFIDHHVTEDIQTREYRAIEVILGAGYDTSADLWSAACLFWELATGEYLFEPNKWRGDATQDEVHVAHIIETCGPIPKHLIERGEYSAEIFDADGQLLNIKNLDIHPLNQVLMERYNWSPNDAKEFAEFLMPMLCTDPLRRVSAYAAINHPWLLLDEEPRDSHNSK
ncbi:SRSF protein kinase 3-like [Drosophila montana]|uniref:SRSF protein kinase 3-like n=1 Tax=Drosophila montana TaxID=40370 RepID=UPI00313C5609